MKCTFPQRSHIMPTWIAMAAGDYGTFLSDADKDRNKSHGAASHSRTRTIRAIAIGSIGHFLSSRWTGVYGPKVLSVVLSAEKLESATNANGSSGQIFDEFCREASMSALLKQILRFLCPHRFSWPHSGIHGQDYQVCLRCGTAFEYDTTAMRRTGRVVLPTGAMSRQ
jgi:hypothetical protein